MMKTRDFYRGHISKCIVFMMTLILMLCVVFSPVRKVGAATSEAKLPTTAEKIGISQTITVTPNDGREGIQRALNQARDNTSGKITKIVLSSGTYQISNSLVVYSNTWIVATGATIISTSGNEPLLVNLYSGTDTAEPGRHANNKNIFITGGTWDGNKNMTTEYSCLVMIRHSSNVIVEGCTFQNSVDHMLNLSGSELCLVDGCTFKDQKELSTTDSEFFQGNTSPNDVQGRYMSCEVLHLDFMNQTGEKADILDGTPVENITVQNCTFTNVFSGLGTHHVVNTSDRTAKDYATSYANSITIKGNTFNNVMGPCIAAYSFNNVVISGNKATNCGHFVNFYGSKNSAITGTNTVTGCYQGKSPYEQHPINVEGSDGIDISGLTISAGTSYAENYNLYITGSKNVNITNSKFSQAKKYAIMVLNSSTVKISSGCEIGSTAGKTVDIVSSTGVTVDGCTLSGGVEVKDASATLNKNTISSAEVYVTGGTSSNKVVISNNTIKNSASNGIIVTNYKGSTEISGNTISGIDNHAINGMSTSSIEIKNNKISNIKNHAVNLESVSNADISSNTFSNLGKKGLRIFKSSNIDVSGNNLSASDIIEENSSGITYLYADASYTGVAKYNGSWYYVKKGVVDKSFTGFAKYNSKWYYVEAGNITLTTTTIAKGAVNGETAWWYVKNSEVQFTDTVAKDSKGDWYGIVKGKSDGSFSGFLSDGKDWWYVQNGRLTFDKTGVYKGTINGKTGWYYAEGSKYTKATKIAKNQVNGTWWRVKDGTLDFSFTDFYQNDTGWWYCKNGQVMFENTGVYKGTINGKTGWWYVKNGKYTKDTLIAKNKVNNTWWRVKDGTLDFGFTGFYQNDTGWWYCKNGQITFSDTGVYKGTINGKTGWYYVEGSKYTKATKIAKNKVNNTWWRVKDGTLDFSFTGFYQNDTGWWYCKNGQITFAETGVFKGTIDGVTGYYYAKGSKFTKVDTIAKNDAGYWVVQNGKVNFNYTGIWSNNSGQWYCVKGKVDFGYTGTVKFNGKTYKIKEGKVE